MRLGGRGQSSYEGTMKLLSILRARWRDGAPKPSRANLTPLEKRIIYLDEVLESIAEEMRA